MSRAGGARASRVIQAGVKDKVAAETTAVDEVSQYWHYGLVDSAKSHQTQKDMLWSISGSFKDGVGHMSVSLNYTFSNSIYPCTICASVLLSLSFPGTKKKEKVAPGVI